MSQVCDAYTQKKRPDGLFFVPEVGIEPTRYCYHRILSPARLPFRHSGPGVGLQSYCKILNLQKLLVVDACGRIGIGQKVGGHLAAGKLHTPEAEEQDGN